MTNEQIKAFHNELGDFCHKHNIGCLSGIWFGDKNIDEHGFIITHDIPDTDMIKLAESLTALHLTWVDDIQKGRLKTTIITTSGEGEGS